MVSLTQWTWVWINPMSWWWTGWHGELQFMGSQRVEQHWATLSLWFLYMLSITSMRQGSHLLVYIINPGGNQSWVFTGRTNTEAETPVLWPPDVKNWLTWKDPDARNDWRLEEKGMTEDEMVGWHHRLNGHEFE